MAFPEPASRTLLTGTIADAVLSRDGMTLYVVRGNTVTALNVASGAALNTFTVGSDLGAIDVSGDGRWLAVVDRQIGTGPNGAPAYLLHRIDTQTGGVTTFFSQLAGNFPLNDVSFLADGSALASTGGGTGQAARLLTLDFASGAFSVVPSTFAVNPVLIASPDKTAVLVDSLAFASFQLALYRSGIGITARSSFDYDPYAGATIDIFNTTGYGALAISADASLLFDGGARAFLDTDLRPTRSLATPYPYLRSAIGAALSPDGQQIYLLEAQTWRVLVFGLADFTPLGSYALDGAVGLSTALSLPRYGNALQVSPDGRFIIVVGSTGIEVIDRTSATLSGGTSGADTLQGEGILYGFDGNDMLAGTGTSELYGGRGDDTYIISAAFSNDRVSEEGGGGLDTILSAARFDLPDGVERLVLTGTADISATGTNAADELVGNAAANSLFGADGNDLLDGGGGNDVLYGGRGADRLVGGDGTDTVSYQDEAAGITLVLRESALVTLGPGGDQLTGIENIEGSRYDDILGGNLDANVLNGGSGNDVLSGSGGDDSLIGDEGNDRLDGGAGNDMLFLGAGNDTIVLSDADGIDRVIDFWTFLDRFDLGGGGFIAARRIGSDTVLTHAGGSITVVGVTLPTLAAWNLLVDGYVPPAPFFLLVPTGANATTLGSGTVFGTIGGTQQVTVRDVAGTVTFDGSYNAGGDRIILAGPASNYSVSRSGATVQISDGDTVVRLPAGAVGADVVFGDGVRSLTFDSATTTVRLGSQTVTTAAAPVTAAAGSAVSTGTTSDTLASQLIVNPGQAATAIGRLTIFGSIAGQETVTVSAGAQVTFDGSFNAGGDTISLAGVRAGWTVSRSGATVQLIGPAGDTVAVPVGTTGSTIRFADGDRTLIFDAQAGAVRLGDVVVTSTPTPVLEAPSAIETLGFIV